MKPTKIQKFTELIRVLEATPEDCFDMSEWHCGTAHCIIGGACLDPWFNAQELTLDSSKPKCGNLYGWDAVERFFEIDDDTSTRLFMGSSRLAHNLRDTVAARVKLLTEYRDSL